jgi:hypothetical protein
MFGFPFLCLLSVLSKGWRLFRLDHLERTPFVTRLRGGRPWPAFISLLKSVSVFFPGVVCALVTHRDLGGPSRAVDRDYPHSVPLAPPIAVITREFAPRAKRQLQYVQDRNHKRTKMVMQAARPQARKNARLFSARVSQ